MTVIPKLPDDIAAMENAVAAWLAAGSGIAAGRIWWADLGQARPDAAGGAWLSVSMLGVADRGQDWLTLRQNPLVLANDAVESVDADTDELTLTAHAYRTGDGPVRLTTTGVLPAGLALATDYWLITTGVDAVQLAASLVDANDAVALDLTDVGTGVPTLVATAATRRVGEDMTFCAQGPRLVTLSVQCIGAPAVGANRATAVLERLRAKASLPTPRAALAAGGMAVARLGTAQTIPGGVINSARNDSRAVLDVTLHAVSEVTEPGSSIATVLTTRTS